MGYKQHEMYFGLKFRMLFKIWLSVQEMDTATRVQILDEADCISHSTNTLGKGMNPIILPPAMGKQQGQTRQLVQENSA